MKKIVFALLLLNSLSLVAQQEDKKPNYLKYEWDAPTAISFLKNISASTKPAYAEILKDFRATEYLYEKDEKTAQSSLACYVLRHTAVKLNDDKGIESYNRVYISTSNVVKFEKLKARSISPKGVVKELNEAAFIDEKDEKTGNPYKKFAIEGLEKGTVIEYYYLIKIYANLYGRETYQKEIPVNNGQFILITPENLTFKIKGYNNLPTTKDTVIDDKRIIETAEFSLPPLFDEKYANRQAHLARYEYKLTYNSVKGKAPVMTYADAARNIYTNVMNSYGKPSKELIKMVNGLKLKSMKEDDKIKTIENYLKSNIAIKKGEEVPSEIDDILKYKFTDENGAAKLFVRALEIAGITSEIVVTCDKFDVFFDDKFESYNYLDKYLIYIPSTNEFIDPTNFLYRYGLIPEEYVNNYGLFIKGIDIGGNKSGIGYIKKINIPERSKTFDNLFINASFDLKNDNVVVDYTKQMQGYFSTFYKPYYSLLDKEDKDKMIDELIKSAATDAEIKNKEVTNFDMNDIKNNLPFTVHSNLTSSSLLEKAGNKYLFKVGNLIGQQVEMYQEEERQLPVEIGYPHTYERTITITVPEGYKIDGLDKLKINAILTEDGKQTCGFTSDYKIENSKITISVLEFYNNLEYPKSLFADYKKVINAAADFNKVVLVLIK